MENHGRTSVIPHLVDLRSKKNTSKSKYFEGAFICRLCQEKCVDEEHVQKHFLSHHSGRLPFKCSNCNSEFDSELNESKHKCGTMNTEEFECVICSKKLPTYNHLYFHINKEHIQKDIICKVCNKMFPNRDALREHSLSHKEGRRFTCVFCSKAFSNSQYLTLHMKRHTSSKVLKCKICFRAFVDKNSLFQHMLLHASMPGIDRPFTCCLCSVSFSQRGGLKFHIEQSHIRKNMLKKCPVCKEVQDHKSMSNHIIQHCSKISTSKMTKVETDWVKKNEPNCSQETFQRQAKGKVKAEMQIKHDRCKLTPNSNSTETPKQTQIFETKTIEATTNEDSKFNIIKSNRLANKKRSTLLKTNNFQLKKVKSEESSIEEDITKQTQIFKTKTIEATTTNEDGKFNITKSNRLANKKRSTLSNTNNSHLKKVKSEEISFEEDLNLVNKRLEESGDSEFEKNSLFFGFTEEPKKTLDSFAIENILDAKKIKREISDSPSIDQSEVFNFESSIPTQKRKDNLLNPVKIEENLTKERPMSFLLVTSNDKTASKSTSDKYNRENTKKRELLQVTTKKKDVYRNKVKESRIKTMLSNTIVNQRKLRTSIKHNKSNLLANVMGKENQSLENNSPSNLEELEENIHCKTEHEENQSLENTSPSNLKELEENIHCKAEHEENISFENDCPSSLEDLGVNIHCQTECKEKLSLENNIPSSLEKLEENIPGQTEEVSKLPCTEESTPSLDKEIKEAVQNSISGGCIQEKKYFEPSRNLSKYGCSMCMLTFSSQDELFLHNAEHVI